MCKELTVGSDNMNVEILVCTGLIFFERLKRKLALNLGMFALVFYLAYSLYLVCLCS